MPELTNKELLKEISRTQKEIAEKALQDAFMFSNFMNKQDDLNKEVSEHIRKFSSYLETNSATNQEGGIAKIDRIEKKLTGLEKKLAYVAGAAFVVFSFIKIIHSNSAI